MDQSLPITTYRKLELAEENMYYFKFIYLLGGQLGRQTEAKNVNIDFIELVIIFSLRVLWFNLILGLNLFSFVLGYGNVDNEFKPRIKLNHNTYSEADVE